MPRHPYNEEDLFKDSTMTFGEHLEELRSCLFKAIVGLTLGFVVGLYFGGDVVDYIQTPLRSALTEYYEKHSVQMVQHRVDELRAAGVPLPDDPQQVEAFVKNEHLLAEEVYFSPAEILRQLREHYPEQFKDTRLPGDSVGYQLDRKNLIRTFIWRPSEADSRVRTKSLSVQESFSIYIKAAFLVGAIVSSPWVFYQLWSFVAAGLYPHEKRYIHVFLPFSLGLFFAGAALAFFFVFQPVLTFLLSFNDWLGIDPDPRINEWMGFVLLLPLGFGVAFQLPLVMLFMERIGIFDVRAYLSKWRMSVLIIFVLSMVLTPSGDPYSMVLMAGPLTALYFGGIALCRYLPRNRSPFDDLDE